ncbi:TRAP transporter small permease [Histidinibacterium lentulum]|uniref:TRAP transporter small permease protein n=1 Tax=Histidinibacterium lentulum TaxID=2480588 RepID=A0A3N2R8T9_9RHOB|nr:TRAP transporter small permease [Histidinibacterium lentulum]ROU03801.1 TRAP transporter small permease [Histidinibacterium lentulum]
MSSIDEFSVSRPPPGDPSTDERPALIRYYDSFTRGLFTVSMLVMLMGMTLVIGLDVILRMGMGQPIRGAHDIVGLSLLLLFLLGLPHSWRGGHHVRMDMIYRVLPRPAGRLVDVFAGLAAFVFAAMLAYQAFKYVPTLIARNAGSMLLSIPYWPFAIAIGVSAILFGIAVLMDLYMALTGRKDRVA